MNDQTRLLSRRFLIALVHQTLAGKPPARKSGRKGTVNRRVTTYGVGRHEVGYHATKGWRVNRRAA